MKKILNLICLIQLCLLHAQEAHIEYRFDYIGASTFKTILDVKDGVTIYLPMPSTVQILNERYRDNGVRATDWEYVKVDSKATKILFFSKYGYHTFLVSDSYYSRKWAITNESKEIAGHTCYKATLDFRGVIWTAWFAPDIPLPYGPWKLYGLPGLIMEASDDFNSYLWKVEKIEYRHGELFNKEFESLEATDNKTPIDIKQYIQEEQEFYDNADAQYLANSPDVITIKPARRAGFEQKYEWEE